MAKSWHVPYISSIRVPHPNECIHVVFLERIPKETREKVLESLKDVDQDWAAQYDADFRPRSHQEIPWIRDYWPSSDVILDIASHNEQRGRNTLDETYNSFVLVDSGWDAGMVVVAHWMKDSFGDRHLDAARVPLNKANALLTLIDNGSLNNLEEGLGGDYDELMVDFYKDLKWEKPKENTTEIAYEPPVFLPKDLKLSENKPEIIALLEVEDETIENIINSVNSHQKAADGQLPVQKIHRWKGPSPTRTNLISLFKWMEGNTSKTDDPKNQYAFFLDYLHRDQDGNPHILAASRPALHVDNVHMKDQISLRPLTHKQFLPFCKEVGAVDDKNRSGDGEKALMEHGKLWAKERVVDITKPLVFDPDLSCPAVFYLCPFSFDQERQIRETFNGLLNETGADSMEEFAYIGPLCPNTDAKHTMEDLRDLFEHSESKSPFFDPKYSTVRMVSYPDHFIAIDERILNQEPQCILASSLDFSDDRYDSIGWFYGDVDASEAHIYWVNLDIANMGPDEMFEAKKLWMSDLTQYQKYDFIDENEDDEENDEAGDGDEGNEGEGDVGDDNEGAGEGEENDNEE